MAGLKGVLRELVRAQEDHPVLPKFRVALTPDGETVTMRRSEEEAWVPVELPVLRDLFAARAEAIAKERSDPYYHGYEPPMWVNTDWRVCELRAANPGKVLTVYVLGGNRAAKTEYCAKRLTEGVVENAGWLTWGLHSDEASSRSVQQSRIWKFLPAQLRPEGGKYQKTVKARMNYNELSGFTENAFALHQGAKMQFKFYSADVKAVEGVELDMAWSDELIPLNWVKALWYRLLTKAGKTRQVAEECKAALAARARGELVQVPVELRKRMFQGVHLISFTAVLGFTPTVSDAMQGLKTVMEEDAELFPILNAAGDVVGYEQVPRVQMDLAGGKVVVYFHNKDNVYGGNWAALKASLADKPRKEKLERAYGVPDKAFKAVFRTFDPKVHVVAADRIPAKGTWYHVVDPCPGRNYFMIWAKVNALDQILVAREWPQTNDYIPGVGYPGPWTELGTGNRLDGDMGPAQQSMGMSINRYKAEIARVERELYVAECRAAGIEPVAGERIKVMDGCRIMDARAANTETLAHDRAVTLIECFEEDREDEVHPDAGPVYFIPAGRDAGGEGVGRGSINHAVELINNKLYYDEAKSRIDPESGRVIFEGVAPSLYVADCCTNVIFSLGNWTGQDGQKGACKDPVDVLRYLHLADPQDTAEVQAWTDGGW